MFYFLTHALNDRIIHEIRRFWSIDPRFSHLADHVQGKYSHRERPQEGIIVKVGGAQNMRLSADNYAGVSYSYCGLAKVERHYGICLEWVREDALAIQRNGGVFPTPPGVYILEVTESDMDQGIHFFTIDPLLTVYDEIIMMADTTTGLLASPFIEGTLRVYESPSGILLKEEDDYTADPLTGEIFFIHDLPQGILYIADYRYQGTKTGPFEIWENRAHHQALPGVVLAFGRRVGKGDKVAIIVSDRREPASLVYYGKWSIPVEIEVFARDVMDARHIVDSTAMYLQFVARSHLSTEGIEIEDTAQGGEMEDIYDETGDEPLFGNSISLTTTTEWSVQVPVPARVRQVSAIPGTLSIAGMTEEEVARVQSNIQVLDNMGLTSFEDPWFKDRSKSFEMIK